MRFAAFVLWFSSVVVAAGELAATPAVLARVEASPAFFNPAAGQRATIAFEIGRPGRLRVEVLDRDRVPVRRLTDHEVAAGPVHLSWDGRDDAGAVVPDEAYTLRIELAHAAGREVYDPAAGFTPVAEAVNATTYSRLDGTLSYRLSRPARVHIQAGQARRDPATGKASGPILKTVLDRVPRVAGSVVETWSGMDESGTVYVPDLPHFAVAVLATSLPENALITVGHRERSFVDYARARPAPGRRPPPRRAAAGAHHRGLTALEDRSPRLDLTVRETGDHTYAVTARLPPADVEPFLRHPTRLLVFLDDRLVLETHRPKHPAELKVTAGDLAPGPHRLVVNWGSEYGPVAVAVAPVVVRGKAEEAGR